MKQVFILLFFFCALGSFGQNTSISSDKKIILPSLVVESTDAENPANINMSTAIPQVGQKYETSQQSQLLLVPVGGNSGALSNSNDVIIMSTATPLPASASTTSQASGLSLTPQN